MIQLEMMRTLVRKMQHARTYDVFGEQEEGQEGDADEDGPPAPLINIIPSIL
jgi:uncharacterized protein (DUF2249 family)